MSTVRKPQKDRTEISFDKLPPHSIDAERSVIGSLLLDPEWCDEVMTILLPEDFWRDAHRRIYKHLVNMRNENMPIDLTLLINRIEKADELEAIGGVAYLGELMQSVSVTAHTLHYARIVHDKSVMRKIIHVGSEIVESAFVETNSAQETLANAEQALFNISETQTTNDIADMKESLLEFCHVMSNKQNDDTIKTGFEGVDKILGGLYSSELAIVAARPSVGKTALAVNIAKHVAFSQQKTVLFVSLEMSRHELVSRFIQTHAGIDGERIRQNRLAKDDYVKLDKAYNDLVNTNIYIDQTSYRTATEIAALARRYKRKHDLRLLVIDYIGLVTPENSRDPRHEQVAKSTRLLKSIARELKISVLCLAQLNRQADNSSGNNRPRLAHLRESGAIEQDADVVMFIHRDEQANDNEVKEKVISSEVEIIIAKNRNGRCGEVRLNWFGEYSRFETPTYHNDNEPSLYDIRDF